MPNINYRTVYAFAREMHPKTVKHDILYGTAGFRARATNLGYVMYRMGLLAVLRARYKRATIGVMITASHNPEPDNGVKLVDPMGDMLDQSWEPWATKFANVDDDQLEATLAEIIAEFDIPMTDRVEIYVGKDTRPSSPSLAKSLMDGVLALSGKPIDFGIVTTPQLHYFVACKNSRRAYGEPTEEGYYKKLCNAFLKLRGDSYTNGNYNNRIFYDGANGVGAKKIKYFQELLADSLKIHMFNDEIIGSGKLNHLCGADYVKTNQKFPNGLPRDKNVRCCSVDGDADRLIYYYLDDNDEFHMLDGDRMATLIAVYISELTNKAGLNLNVGLVQTAYANGASTEFISKKLGIPVTCTPTGVKHLHEAAQRYDVGIYFEANGHGTVVFSSEAKQIIRSHQPTSNVSQSATDRIGILIDLINETVGDAISDMLLIETILHAKGWSIEQWYNDTYVDLPNRLMKVVVRDRKIIQVTDAERVCVSPEGLQQEIDNLVKNYDRGRAFVRPSGTEDIVRIYAEAATKSQADQLAMEVATKVHEMADGVGPLPTID